MTFSSVKTKTFPELGAEDIPKQLGKLIYVYGSGGSGKTTLAGSLYDYPPTEDTFWLVSDKRGLSSIKTKYRKQLKWTPIDSWQQLKDWIEQNKEHPSHRNLVIDHLTKNIVQCFTKHMGHPSQWHWEKYSTQTADAKGVIEDLD